MKDISIMINGLPGKMATAFADLVLSEDYHEIFGDDYAGLAIFSLTGQEITENSAEFSIHGRIQLIKPEDREKEIGKIKEMYKSFRLDGSFISVDYTHPNAVNENADFYCRHNLPFVMGTTGGDRKALEERVKNSEISAVIAPNMAKQIVAFQAMMKYASETFPNAFKSYTLEIVESHQKGKADTSGTAKAMVEYFNKLGIPFRPDQITMIRDPQKQIEMGIPQNALTGHGWHTYTLKSKDNSVLFQFTHNVNGREIYAKGTLNAVSYLNKKLKEGSKGQVYSMMDVLKGA